MGLAPCCGETPVAPRSGAAAEDRSQFMGPYTDILQDRSSCFGQQQLLASLHVNSPSNYQHRLRSLFNVKPIVEEAASLPSKEGSRHLSPPLPSPGFCGASNTTLVCISATGRDCRRASGLEHHPVLLYKHISRLL